MAADDEEAENAARSRGKGQLGKRGRGGGAAEGEETAAASGGDALSPAESALLVRFWWAVGALKHHGVIRPSRRQSPGGPFVEKCLFNVVDW
jgi:hypothetical protein